MPQKTKGKAVPQTKQPADFKSREITEKSAKEIKGGQGESIIIEESRDD